jgi:hypothetical protein
MLPLLTHQCIRVRGEQRGEERGCRRQSRERRGRKVGRHRREEGEDNEVEPEGGGLGRRRVGCIYMVRG